MDLEWANAVDLPMGEYNPNTGQTPPEVAESKDGIRTTACDMWQFGNVPFILVTVFWRGCVLIGRIRRYLRRHTDKIDLQQHGENEKEEI